MKKYKALWFTGREHHAAKMVDIIRFLQNQEFDVLPIVANNVVNFDNYETPLVLNGVVDYKTIYQYLNTQVMSEIRRKTHEMTSNVNHIIEAVGIPVLDYLDEFYFRFSYREMIEVYELYKQAISEEKPDVFFILHEGNFWGKIIAYLCQEMGVYCVSFQEGDYTRVPHCQFSGLSLITKYSDLVCNWGNVHINAIERAGADVSRCRPLGAPHLDKFINSPLLISKEEFCRKFSQDHSNNVVLFLLPLFRIAPKNILDIIDDVVQWFGSNPHLSLILRGHPFDKANEILFNQKYKNMKNIVIDSEMELHEIVQFVDACLLQQTTAGDECLAFGVPLIEVPFTGTSIPGGYYEKGVALEIQNKDELSIIDEVVKDGSPISKKFLQDYLSNVFYSLDGRTCERIHQEVVTLLESKGAGK